MPSFKLATSSTKLSYAVAKFFKTSSLKLASLLDCFILENSWCETLLKERFMIYIYQIKIVPNIFIAIFLTIKIIYDYMQELLEIYLIFLLE